MKKIIWRYGGYSALAELISFILVWLLLDFVRIDIGVQGSIGWVVIICPLIFVYFGIRYYRDQVNNDSITFLKALQLGLLMMLIPAFAYAIIETVYVIYIDPNFYARIATYEMEQYRKTLPAAEFVTKVKEMKQQLVLDNNPLFNFGMMVLTISALGAIITLISSLLLKKTAK